MGDEGYDHTVYLVPHLCPPLHLTPSSAQMSKTCEYLREREYPVTSQTQPKTSAAMQDQPEGSVNVVSCVMK